MHVRLFWHPASKEVVRIKWPHRDTLTATSLCRPCPLFIHESLSPLPHSRQPCSDPFHLTIQRDHSGMSSPASIVCRHHSFPPYMICCLSFPRTGTSNVDATSVLKSVHSSPSPPRDATGSPHSSPRTSSMSPRHDVRPPNRPTAYQQQREDATPAGRHSRLVWFPVVYELVFLTFHRGRHAESSVAQDTEDQERTPTPSRQVYNSPFASYSWSRYRPSSKDPNTPPLLYVEYRQHPPSNAAPRSLSGSFSSLCVSLTSST